MAEKRKGQIQIFAKNIKGNARGEIREDAKYIKNIAGGKHVQNGFTGGVNNGTNQPRKEALRVVKIEGPFDENNSIVDTIEKEKWYMYKAKFNREPKEHELNLLKWAREFDENDKKMLIDVSNRGLSEIKYKIIDNTINNRVKIFAYFQQPTVFSKAEIVQGEILFIIGTEQHSQTYGNKLMFPAQAVREIRQYHKNHKHTNILIFKDQYTDMQMSIIKRDAKKWNPLLYFKKINSVDELIKYLNEGDVTINRRKNKISIIKIYSHGLPSILDFGLDGDNEQKQRFTISHISKLKKESFTVNSEIYSYACRTGNLDNRIETANPNYQYDESSLKYVKSNESLAQKLSNYLDAKVYAYLRRSNYTPTWLDNGDENYKRKYITIEDENVSNPFNPKDWFRRGWDEALWNSDGAYLPPKSGNSPGGLLEEGLFLFQKDKDPKKL